MTDTSKITWRGRAKQQLFLSRLFYTALDKLSLFRHFSKKTNFLHLKQQLSQEGNGRSIQCFASETQRRRKTCLEKTPYLFA